MIKLNVLKSAWSIVRVENQPEMSLNDWNQSEISWNQMKGLKTIQKPISRWCNVNVPHVTNHWR